MTPSFPFVPAAALLALLLAAPSSVAAQSQEATPPTGREAAAAELAFEREVFAYPVFQRRNPFAPLLANGAAGPRFEIMRLEGILYDPDPRFSLALIAAGRVDPDQQRQNQGDPLGLAPPAGQVGGPGEATVQGDVSEQGVQQEAAPERTRPAGVARSLRVGERWGNIRVVEIRPDVVVVDVEEFGVAERKIMRLADERSQGGSS